MARFFRRKAVTGAERKRVKGDIRLVLAADRPDQDKEPLAEKHSALINSVRYFGDREGDTPAEAMTSTSAALYEYLLARALPELTSKEEHLVSFQDAKAFLKIEKSSRLRECIDDLTRTWVSYQFMNPEEGKHRIARRVPLLHIEEEVGTYSGERSIAYSMHPSVRQVILSDGTWAVTEIAAYPLFTSKYTWLLYPRLALMAGRKLRPDMRWTPEELAAELGWKPKGAFKFSNFESRVLLPVLADIKAHVRRFGVSCQYVRAATRGRPVSQIILTVGAAVRAPAEFKKAEMTKGDRTRVRRIAADAGVDLTTQMPGEDILRRAATRLGKPVTVIASMWTEAFGEPLIMEMLERDGLKSAFEEWLQQQQAMQSDADEEVDFDAARAILVTLAEGYSVDAALDAIDGHLWTGAAAKTMRIIWSSDGEEHQQDIEITPTERDLALLLHANQDIIEDMEYAA
ncbi:replication initiation protein [Sinorhizobium meliloti]|uniref:replication initiation protein n=1 Tax=Rhizobium meliloti TaxID=382 RepID=UPI000FE00911|nr:replication initiation protein [Sinorhizobium meliloti]RVG70875.1 RepB family plasmid replication initiator protein [Sinorhizobium meliloti]